MRIHKKNIELYFIIGLVLLNAFTSVFSLISMDSARDLFYAKNISDGIGFPLVGPDIGGFAHVGPVWFYFLAVPLLTGSLSLAAFWVGIFSSLKIFLAYQLGKKIIDEKFGLLWAAALFLPGWHTIDPLILLHTNLVQTLTLAFLYSVYEFYKADDCRWFKWAMLFLALTIHAHPSGLVLGVFLVWSVFSKRKVFNLRSFLCGVLFFILPFIPYLVDQARNNFSEWQAISSLAEVYGKRTGVVGKTNEHLTVFQRFPRFIESLFYSGPVQIKYLISAYSPVLGKISFVTYVLIILASFLGLLVYSFQRLQHARLTAGMVAVFSLLALMILSLRSFIPFYMTLVLVPFSSAIIAFGLWNLVAKVGKPLLVGIMYFLFALSVLPLVSLTVTYQDHHLAVQKANEIESEVDYSTFYEHPGVDALSVYNTLSFDPVFCGDLYVHGSYAQILDYTSAFPVYFYCPDHTIKLGGKQGRGQQHLLVMHRSFWLRSHMEPESWVNNVFAYTHDFINHSHSRPWQIAPFQPYVHPQRENMKMNPAQTFHYEFEAPGGSVVVITNLLPFNAFMKIEEVTVDGDKQKALLAYKNFGNRLYRCEDCDSSRPVHWSIKIATNQQDAIDINEIPPKTN